MKLIGLTGGSGSGKTTAAKHFLECGATVIDADLVAREVVLPNSPALCEIKNVFGDQYVNSDGTLNRTSLGSLVFSDVGRLKQLNNIMIPAILKRINETITERKADGKKVVILDAPLLFEYHLDEICDAIVLMCTPLSVRVERLMLRDGLSREAVMNRITSQSDYDSYVKRATYLLDASDASTLEREVKRIFRTFEEEEACEQNG